MGPASPMIFCPIFSIPSLPPRCMARALGCRSWPRSSTTMAASSNANPSPGERSSVCCCRWPLPKPSITIASLFMPEGTILVCDDDAAIRTVLNQALGRAGYDVRTTANAAGLWRWIAQGEGNLVITDVILPDENAFDLLPRIKRLRPDLPVVVMSAQNNILTAITATERGAYEYLPKPFDLKELINVVGRALAAPSRKRATAELEPGDERLPLIGR